MLPRRDLTNIAVNVSSLALPMLTAVAVLPGLLSRLGTERFGLLSLSWALVGYFGLLDLGLGRALTQYLAQCEAQGMVRPLQSALARDARRIMVGLGFGWALLIGLLTPWLTQWFSVGPALKDEVLFFWPMVGISVPILMWISCCTGVLEARSRFMATNAVRVPMGIATFAAPWLVSFYTSDLRAMMIGMIIVRLASATALTITSKRDFSEPAIQPPAGGWKVLLQFGGWLTVSNIVGPIMVYFDRFAIGATLSVVAVATYTIPQDIITRITMIPAAMMSVLFPLLSEINRNHSESKKKLHSLVHGGTRLMTMIWIPMMVVVFWIGPILLEWWINAEVARNSTLIWRYLALGVLINGLAYLPFTLLQSDGKTDLIAKLHLIELIPYCILLIFCLIRFGLVGAAIAWTVRVVIDAVLLTWFAIKNHPEEKLTLNKSLALGMLTLSTLAISTMLI